MGQVIPESSCPPGHLVLGPTHPVPIKVFAWETLYKSTDSAILDRNRSMKVYLFFLLARSHVIITPGSANLEF